MSSSTLTERTLPTIWPTCAGWRAAGWTSALRRGRAGSIGVFAGGHPPPDLHPAVTPGAGAQVPESTPGPSSGGSAAPRDPPRGPLPGAGAACQRWGESAARRLPRCSRDRVRLAMGHRRSRLQPPSRAQVEASTFRSEQLARKQARASRDDGGPFGWRSLPRSADPNL